MVNKATIMQKINKASGLPLRDASVCIDILINTIAEAAAKGERIELRGFGTFFIKKTAAKRITLPNAAKIVPEHGRIMFRPCEKLREAVWNKRN
jgi:nucleoid DNA-binding protein